MQFASRFAEEPEPEPRIVQISTGGLHAATVSASHVLYTWGCGKHGKLGHGTNSDRFRPCAVVAIQRFQIVGVSCGSDHTTAASADGRCFSWGAGEFCRLGHGTHSDEVSPRMVQGPSTSEHDGGFWAHPVRAIASGTGHTVAVTADGSLWSWGAGWEGQLGQVAMQQGGGDEHVKQSSGPARAATYREGAVGARHRPLGHASA